MIPILEIGQITIVDIGTSALSVAAISISVWELFLSRPRLRATANGNSRLANAPGAPRQVTIVGVTNRGRQPTTITVIEFAELRPWWKRFRRPFKWRGIVMPVNYGTTLPHTLEVGRTSTVVFDSTAAMQSGETLLQIATDRNLYAVIRHSWSDRPLCIRVTV